MTTVAQRAASGTPSAAAEALSIATVANAAAVSASLRAIEAELDGALIERAEVIRLALVALVARQHMLILGPPGTSKSHLITSIADRVAAPGGGGLSRFVYLMTKTTTPNELFGPYSIPQMRDHERFVRVTTDKLPEAQLVFLDEIFKSNSSALNTLLTITNERAFDNGGRQEVPLISLFGASNELPQGDDLGALWDRFILRTVVGYVSDAGFGQLLRLGRPQGPQTTIDEVDLRVAQDAAAAVAIDDSTLGQIEQLRKDLLGSGIVASDRRWVQALGILRANAYLDGRPEVDEDDLALLSEVLWQVPDQRGVIRSVAGKISNPMNARAVELGDQASSVYETFKAVEKDAAATDEQKGAKAMESITKLRKVRIALDKLRKEQGAGATGRVVAKIDKVVKEVEGWQKELLEIATGA